MMSKHFGFDLHKTAQTSCVCRLCMDSCKFMHLFFFLFLFLSYMQIDLSVSLPVAVCTYMMVIVCVCSCYNEASWRKTSKRADVLGLESLMSDIT